MSLSAVFAYLAVRRGNHWLDADPRQIEPYLPRGWRSMPLWRLMDHMDVHDIGPLY